MNTFSYVDDDGTEYDVTFDYDPLYFGEDEPSQSPWNYIFIEEITNSDGETVEFDDDKLYDIKLYLWREFRGEF